MKAWTVAALILLVLLGTGAFFVFNRAAPTGELLVSMPSTASVRQGDLIVNVTGNGELVAEEINLGFSISGEVSEMSVAVGDKVQAGEILGRLHAQQAELDLKTAQLNWATLTEPQVMADAELRFLNYQQDLATAQEALAYVRDGPPVDYYQTLVDQALKDYEEIRQEYSRALRLSSISPKQYKPMVKKLAAQKEKAWEAVEAARAELDWVKNYQPDSHDLALAEAQAALAAAHLAAQEHLLDVLRGGPLPSAEATLDRNQELLGLEKAKLTLDKAEWTLNQTKLVAPASGTVTEVFVAPGERVDGVPVLTLSLLDPPLVRFYLEEVDLAQVSTGDRLDIHLDAYPEQIFQGSVTRIDPELVTVDGSRMAQVWGKFNTLPGFTVLPGMGLEVDVIAAEAIGTLLVPIQALRQNSDGSYFVEVLQSDGSFQDDPVHVGLKDLANVQILSGLQAGDVVSTAPR